MSIEWPAFLEDDGIEAEVAQEDGTEPEVTEPTPCKGCQDNQSILDQLKITSAHLEGIDVHIKDLDGRISALARQQQVLSDHQKAVAENQAWMANQVGETIQNIPSMLSGMGGPLGKMMGRMVGGGKEATSG